MVESEATDEMENGATSASVSANNTTSPTVRAARRRSQSLSDLRNNAALAFPFPLPPLATLPESANANVGSPRRKPVPILDSEAVETITDNHDYMTSFAPSASWRSFSEEGFFASGGGMMSTASSDLSLSEFEYKPTLSSRRSQRSLSRIKSSTSKRSLNPIPSSTTTTTTTTMTHTITAVKRIELDTSLAILWQDTLQDQSPTCKLPTFVFVQLRHEKGWLLVVESVIPPRPPTPPPGIGRKSSWRTPTGISDDTESVSDRKSIFAPSIRSVRMRLRRVSTVIGTGLTSATTKRRDKIIDHPPPSAI